VPREWSRQAEVPRAMPWSFHYPFRAVATRQESLDVVAGEVSKIDYGTFKNLSKDHPRA
jgi:hypothetical protein